MTVGLSFVTIEVEELSSGKVHFGGDLINLARGVHNAFKIRANLEAV
jgi:hypothetical protein